MKRHIITTEDGSHTLSVPEMGEHYHSTHGAVQESQHVFIEAGLNQLNIPKINILEVGLGTGLNAFLTYKAIRNKAIAVEYFGIEKYPLNQKEYELLNYGGSEYRNDFLAIHQAAWDKPAQISNDFSLIKLQNDITTMSMDALPPINLIYFDAFAPNKQSESGIWTPAVFQKLYNACAPEAILVTYCAQGQVRRDFQSVGFTVERIPGPPGKREMLRCKK